MDTLLVSEEEQVNCSDMTNAEQVEIKVLYTVSGAVCSVILLLTILLLLFYRQFDTLLKRLFLYALTATTLRSFTLTATYDHNHRYSTHESACIWAAYVFDWAGIVLGAYMIGLMSYLFYLVYRSAQGNRASTPPSPQSNCFRRTCSMEVVYVILVPLTSFAYASIPYISKDYGLTNAQCWIKIFDTNCTLSSSGVFDQVMNGYVLFIIQGLIILTFGIAIVFTNLCKTPSLGEARLLIKKTLIVLSCLLVRILVIVAAFVIQFSAGHRKVVALQVCMAIAYPISLLLFPFVFILCFSKLRHTIKEKLCYLKNRIKNGKHVPLRDETSPLLLEDPITIGVSTRISPRSSTYSNSSPYTGGFTDITLSTAILVRANRAVEVHINRCD